MTQMVKNLPAMQGTRVRSLAQEDSLEQGIATHSSILDWRIPWTEELAAYDLGVAESDMTEQLTLSVFHFYIEKSYVLYSSGKSRVMVKLTLVCDAKDLPCGGNMSICS